MANSSGATIIPESLPPVNIEQYFKHSFSVSGGSLISVEITRQEQNKGVFVEGSLIFGEYHDPFVLDSDSIHYRIGDKFIESGAWEDVPHGEQIDVYYWRAPSPLVKVYKYLVKVTYLEEQESSGGDDGGSTAPPVPKTISKMYSHTVYGTWDKWQNTLRDKIKERDSVWQD